MALKNPVNMGNINQQELQSLREIISSHQTMATKFDFYSNQCQDQQIKQLFKQSSQDASTTATSLINSLK
jgi:hypothetical protein